MFPPFPVVFVALRLVSHLDNDLNELNQNVSLNRQMYALFIF